MPNPVKSRGDLFMWLMLAGIWAATFVYPHTPLDGEVLCVWRRITTLNCPGCGLTRSFCAMSQLDIAHAFVLHPVGPFLYMALVWLVLSAGIRHILSASNLLQVPPKIMRGYWIIAGVVFAFHMTATVASWLSP